MRKPSPTQSDIGLLNLEVHVYKHFNWPEPIRLRYRQDFVVRPSVNIFKRLPLKPWTQFYPTLHIGSTGNGSE